MGSFSDCELCICLTMANYVCQAEDTLEQNAFKYVIERSQTLTKANYVWQAEDTLEQNAFKYVIERSQT